MSANIKWITSPDSESLANALSDDVANLLRSAIDEKGDASLVVSGGSTPLPFFKALSQQALNWSKVKVTLADERWVPFDSPDSNERFVKENLLINQAKDARFQSLYVSGSSAAAALPQLETSIATVPRPFTVVILGMGGDGHTASLFPETVGLEDAMDLSTQRNLAVLKPASVNQTRISLTRRALLDSRNLIVHITGESKRDLLKRVLEDVNAQPGGDYLPIGRFFEDESQMTKVYWSP